MLDLAAQFVGIESEDDDDARQAASRQRADDAFDERLAVDRQQRLRPAHAARFTGGENDGSDHFMNQRSEAQSQKSEVGNQRLPLISRTCPLPADF